MPGWRAETLLWLAGLLALLLSASGDVSAHPLAPALLELREGQDGRVSVRFRSSLYRRPGVALEAELPRHCRALRPARTSVVANGQEELWELDCSPQGLVGGRISVGGLEGNQIDALLRIELLDGRRFGHVLRPGSHEIVVPARASRWDVVPSYLGMGAIHIFSGPDHLLFLLGLLLLAASLRALLLTLTAFTLGHCVTLTAASLGWLQVPVFLTEPMIAASLLVLAVRLAPRTPRGSSPEAATAAKLPAALALAFGMLHGLGFAAGLLEAGLPAGEIPLALFAFNVGIELGQLSFVLPLFMLAGLLRAPIDGLPVILRRVPIYAMGGLAGFWLIERSAGLFG